jgi:hypothetical protein
MVDRHEADNPGVAMVLLNDKKKTGQKTRQINHQEDKSVSWN